MYTSFLTFIASFLFLCASNVYIAPDLYCLLCVSVCIKCIPRYLYCLLFVPVCVKCIPRYLYCLLFVPVCIKCTASFVFLCVQQ